MNLAQVKAATGTDIQFEKQARRYDSILSRRPRAGTAFDLLYRLYCDSGKLDELVTKYNSKAAAAQDSHIPHLILGLIHERNGNQKDALEVYWRACQLAPHDYYAFYRRGLIHVAERDHERAILELEQSISNKPPKSELLAILKRLGRIYIRKGNSKDATRVWQRITDHFPDDPRALEELAKLLTEEQQFGQAIVKYKQLIELPNADRQLKLIALLEIGNIYDRQGESDRALDTFIQCLEMVKPDSWHADSIRQSIEDVFYRRNDPAGLAAYYEAWLQSHPDDLAARLQLAATNSRLGNVTQALVELNQAVTLAPSNRAASQTYIDTLVKANQLNRAIAQFERLLAIYPDDLDYLSQLGQLHLRAGGERAEIDAVRVWSRIAATDGADATRSVQVAELCRAAAGIGPAMWNEASSAATKEASRLSQAALRYYRQAVGRSPNVPQYHEYLGEFLLAMGQKRDAITQWRQLAAPPNDTPDNLKRLSEIYQRAGERQLAIDAALRAVNKAPNRYELRDGCASLLAEAGQFERALEHVTAMERLASTPYLVKESLERRVELYSRANRLTVEMTRLQPKLNSADAGPRDHWLAAMLAASVGQSSTAIGYLDHALKSQPNHIPMLRTKAELHQQVGDIGGATRQYERLARLDAQRRTEYLKRTVQMQLDMGRTDLAAKTAQDIVRLSPGNAASLQTLAEVHFRRGDVKPGLDALRRAVQMDPRNVEIRHQLAARLYHNGRIDEALEHYWQALELADNQDNRLAITRDLTDRYAFMGRVPDLVSRLRKLFSDDLYSQSLCLAAVYNHGNEFHQAREVLQRLLARRPGDVQVLTELVRSSDELNEMSFAARYQERIVELEPSRQNLVRLAELHKRAGNHEKESSTWTRLSRAVGGADDLLSMIQQAGKQRRHDRIIALAEPYWRQNPNDWRFGLHLAWAYWYVRNYQRAEHVSDSVIRLHDFTASKSKLFPTISQPSASQTTANLRPREVRRIKLAMSLGSTLRNANASALHRVAGNDLELTDAKLICAIVRYETAKLGASFDEWFARLREASSNSTDAAPQRGWTAISDRERAGELEDVLTQWIRLCPDDPTPRLAMVLVPLRYRPVVRQQFDRSDRSRGLLDDHYLWLTANRPDLARWISSSYLQRILGSGDHDRARQFVHAWLADESLDLQAMARMWSIVEPIADRALLDSLLAKVKATYQKDPSQARTHEVQKLLRTIASSSRDVRVLDALAMYIESTHPASLLNASPLQHNPSYTVAQINRGNTLMPSGKSIYRTGHAWQTGLLAPTPFLNSERLTILRHAHQLAASKGFKERLERLVQDHIRTSEGVARQCWQMCAICLASMDGNFDGAVDALTRLNSEARGNRDLIVMLGRVHLQNNQPDRALQCLERAAVWGVDKEVEHLRLSVAMQLSDEATARSAATRLLQMRLDLGEQVTLSNTLTELQMHQQRAELIERIASAPSVSLSQLYSYMIQADRQSDGSNVDLARLLLKRVHLGSSQLADRYRRDAYRILKASGQLPTIIQQAEEDFAENPTSIDLAQQLVELHSAAEDQRRAIWMLERLGDLRPGDAAWQLRVARELIKRSRTADGLRRLATVWDNDPQLLLANPNETRQFYAQARRWDLLAQHLGRLRGRLPPAGHATSLTTLLSRFGGASGEDILQLHRVASEILPADSRQSITFSMGSQLERRGLWKEAYQLYARAVIPVGTGQTKPVINDVPVGSTNTETFSRHGKGLLTKLVDASVRSNTLEHLGGRITASARDHPNWQPTGQLLRAMLQRRKGDEQAITLIAQRYLSDSEFQSSIFDHYATLVEELQKCKSKPALEKAVALWTSMNHASDSTTNMDELAEFAEMLIKLNRRDEARTVLLAAADRFPRSETGGRSSPDRTFHEMVHLAEQLKQFGFLMDAVRIYDQLTQQRTVPVATPVSRNSARKQANLHAAMHRCVEHLVAHELTAAVAALRRELESETTPRLSHFFVITGDNTDAILLSILKHAAAMGQLSPLTTALESRLQKRVNGDDLGFQLATLDVLTSLAAESDKAQNKLLDWMNRVTREPALAQRRESLPVVLMALSYSANQELGQKIAVRVGRNRQWQVPIAKAIIATSKSEAGADETVRQVMSGSNTPAQSNFAVAQAYFERERSALGIRYLESVWMQQPELILAHYGHILDEYVVSGRLAELAAGINSAVAHKIQLQYRYKVSKTFDTMRGPPADVQGMTLLLDALVAFCGERNRASIASDFRRIIRAWPDNQKKHDAYRIAVFPSEKRLGYFADFGHDLMQTARDEVALSRFESQCHAACSKFPDWSVQGEFLLAMIQIRRGDSGRMQNFVHRMNEDADLADLKKQWGDLLRQQLVQCTSGPAAETALELLHRDVVQARSGISESVARLSDFLFLLEDDTRAKRTLLELLEVPFQTPRQDGGYHMRLDAERRRAVAQQLVKHGHAIDAVGVYASICRIDTSRLVSRSDVQQEVQDALEEGQAVAVELIENKSDALLAWLQARLSPDVESFDVSPLWAVIDPPVPKVATLLAHGAAEAPESVWLLPNVLARASSVGRLNELSDALRSLATKFPQQPSLTSMQLMLDIAGNQTDEATAGLRQVLHDLETSGAKSKYREFVWPMAMALARVDQMDQTYKELLTKATAIAEQDGNAQRFQLALCRLHSFYLRQGEFVSAAEAMVRLFASQTPSSRERLRVAECLVQQGHAAIAFRALRELWRQQPKLLASNLEYSANLYSHNGRFAEFIELIRRVQDGSLRNHIRHKIGPVTKTLVKENQTDEAIALYRVAVDLSTATERQFALTSLAVFLEDVGRHGSALDAYVQAVTDSAAKRDHLPSFSTTLVDLAHRLDKSERLEEACRKCMMSNPAWTWSAEIMLAMIARRQGDESPLENIAMRCQEDESYRRRVLSSGDILRDELQQCSSTSALTLATQLWEPELERLRKLQQGLISHETYEHVARLYLKRGDTPMARKLLLESLALPVGSHYTSSYLAFRDFERRKSVARNLVEAGFELDAIALYQQNLDLPDVIEMRRDSKIAASIQEQKQELRRSVFRLLSEKLDWTLDQLITSIENRNDMHVFSVVVDSPWTLGECRMLPTHLRHNDGSSQLQLLPALFLQAAATNRKHELDATLKSIAQTPGEIDRSWAIRFAAHTARQDRQGALELMNNAFESDRGWATDDERFLILAQALHTPKLRAHAKNILEKEYIRQIAYNSPSRQALLLDELTRAELAELRSQYEGEIRALVSWLLSNVEQFERAKQWERALSEIDRAVRIGGDTKQLQARRQSVMTRVKQTTAPSADGHTIASGPSGYNVYMSASN